jgi:hypothetical protein
VVHQHLGQPSLGTSRLGPLVVLFNTIGPLPDTSKSDDEERKLKIVQKRRAAINIVEAALRRHRINDLDEVSPKTRAKVITEIKLALDELEVPHPEEEGQ